VSDSRGEESANAKLRTRTVEEKKMPRADEQELARSMIDHSSDASAARTKAQQNNLKRQGWHDVGHGQRYLSQQAFLI
jgi:hypothetical protein